MSRTRQSVAAKIDFAASSSRTLKMGKISLRCVAEVRQEECYFNHTEGEEKIKKIVSFNHELESLEWV